MEHALIYFALVVVGLILGSFAGATVWRLRARQLVEDKKAGEPYDKQEYARLEKLTEANISNDRSQCLYCSYTLRWYDLIPLVSWLSLGGKCRNCRHTIGYFEPLIEISVAAFFVLSYAFWPYDLVSSADITRLIIWLVAGVALAMLFVYDAKWFLLPDIINRVVIILGLVSVILQVIVSNDVSNLLGNILGSVIILSGLYLLLYALSRGRWIGFGDVKLGLGLGLLLADWKLAFIALFAANLIGCLMVLPGLLTGKLNRDARVPFGPLLILGLVVAQLVGPHLIAVYMNSLF